jgi:uncharacterized membrane protein YkvA (DUF1232 family)
MADYDDTAFEATRVDPEKFARDEARVRQGFWPKVRRLAGRINFVEDAVAAYYCARDPDTPFRVKAVIMGALAYFVLPMDVVPDVLVALGLVDDAAVIGYAFSYVSKYVQPRHRDQARGALQDLETNQPSADDAA